MINPVFTNKYSEETFAEFIQSIIPSLSFDKKRPETRTGFKSIQQIAEVGENKLDLVVFVAKLDSSLHARVEITKNTYAVLKNHARSNALVAYVSDDSPEWRLSLITTKVTRTKEGIRESISNPRRFSYVLGPSAKVATPSKMLQGTIDSIIDLENKFSLAVVSKEFFTQIATQYSKLVGGTRGEGRKATIYERTLKLGITDDAVNANFAIRLIGRLVFCWFLKQKKGHLDNPLIPSEILSVSAVKTIGDYYHSVCVPLFFEVLNKPQSSRPIFFSHAELFDKVPFLNGGLFQDHTEDNHKFNRTTGMSERRGVVNIPDIWFSELFQIFEEYNFTIDENTSIDTELSIDPEMLGRIFENLLAEVNPETGASARKSTGSFYTPREIVDFMVEESLVAHLKTKTNISEEKLRALSSYDLDDDASNPIDQQERKLLVEAIHNTTVLDPACGSGAFPIGVLQRLVHMLGVLDPECSIYLSKIPPEMRRQFQKHSLTYIRKLGVIRECIHGVDIQPIAIDISRLRCFLTLIVDQQVDDNAENRGIEPLPNLDFKFVCANTLIKPPFTSDAVSLFGDEFATALGELVDEYFAPIDQNHKLVTAGKLKDLIGEKTKRELENIINDTGLFNDPKLIKKYKDQKAKSNNERVQLIDLWDSYKNIFQNKPVGFFDTRYFFPIVFRNGGFDIVIGNPPYVSTRTKDFDSNLKEYFKNNYSLAVGQYDLFTLFIEKSNYMLNKEGILSFIVPKKLLTNENFEAARKFLLENIPVASYLDAQMPFEAAGVEANVIVSTRNVVDKIKTYLFDGNKIEFKHEVENSLILLMPFKIFPFAISPNNVRVIDSILKKCPTSFGNYLSIIRGMECGFNHSSISKNKSKYKIIKGEHIQKYYIKETEWYVDLDFYDDKVFKSKDIYQKLPKLLTKFVANSIDIALDDFGYFNTNVVYNIHPCPGKEYLLKYFLALGNSKVVNFWFLNTYINDDKLFPHIQKNQLDSIPVIIPSDVDPFEKLVDRILAITKSSDYLENPGKKEEVKEYEKQIDQLVYKLYDLTPEEIEIVENSIKK